MSTLSLMEHEQSGVVTTTGYTGIIGYILGLYKDNGKENGNYYLFCFRRFQAGA